MARLNLTLTLAVPEGYSLMLESLGEALAHSHFEGDLEIETAGSGLTHKGVPIVRFGSSKKNDGAVVIPIMPGVGLPMFPANILILLPPRASVEWDGPWPIFKCPPRDDDSFEDDPSPLVPDALCLA